MNRQVLSSLLNIGNKSLSIFFVLTIFLNSCLNKKVKSDSSKKLIAKVFDSYLYEDEVLGFISNATTKKDTADFINSYASNWVKQQLLLHKAEQNLSDEEKNVAKQLEDYRQSLIIYKYQNQLVHQKLDTIISDEEIEKYYNENAQNFELKDNIIKVNYIKVNKKAPDINKLKMWYKSEVEKDRKLLESYCLQYAENYYLDNNTWLLFADILKEIPIETYNQELFLKNNRFVEVQDSLSLYLLNIKGFKIKNSISPLAFEKENIKNILINKRKIELIEMMHQDVYNSAVDNKDVEVFKYE